MNGTIRNILIVLFTVGILVGVAILAVDAFTADSSARATSDLNVEIVQPRQQVQTVSEDGSSAASAATSLASKMGVVALIIFLVFLVQMGVARMLRKLAQGMRW